MIDRLGHLAERAYHADYTKPRIDIHWFQSTPSNRIDV